MKRPRLQSPKDENIEPADLRNIQDTHFQKYQIVCVSVQRRR